ncbi:MAG: hypothetical protein RL029_422 [Actinomycetota bacterium]|jgi:hypothetical protein
MSKPNYFRYAAYALIAVGLINLRYQSGKSDLNTTTFLIVGTGVVIFALTYLNFGKKFLNTSVGKAIVAMAAVAAGLLAILN